MPGPRHMLAASSLVLFSFYYVYDLPAALNNELVGAQDHVTRLARLYSAYSLPNTFMPLVYSSLALAQHPTSPLVLTLVALAGQILFNYGVYRCQMPQMLLGRFLYGIGVESFGIYNAWAITQAFSPELVVYALAVSSSAAKVGSVSSFALAPYLSLRWGPLVPVCIGTLLLTVALLACLALGALGGHSRPAQTGDGVIVLRAGPQETKPTPKQPAGSWFSLENFKQGEHGARAFVLFSLVGFLSSAAFTPVNYIGPLLYMRRYGVSRVLAGRYAGLSEVVSLLFSGALGFLANRCSSKSVLVLLGGFLLVASNLLLLENVYPLLTVCIFGVSSPLVSMYWPCIADVAESHYLSRAFAAVTCILNVSATVSPAIYSWIIASDRTYTHALCLSVVLSLAILAIAFNILRKNLGKVFCSDNQVTY